MADEEPSAVDRLQVPGPAAGVARQVGRAEGEGPVTSNTYMIPGPYAPIMPAQCPKCGAYGSLHTAHDAKVQRPWHPGGRI